MRLTKSTNGITASQSIDSSKYFVNPPAAKVNKKLLLISFLNAFTNSVKLFLSVLSHLWPGYPSIAGYSQSRSRPSIPYSRKRATVVFANVLRCSGEANKSEHGPQPPHPPIDTMIFNRGYCFFNSTSCCNDLR